MKTDQCDQEMHTKGKRALKSKTQPVVEQTNYVLSVFSEVISKTRIGKKKKKKGFKVTEFIQVESGSCKIHKYTEKM